MKQAVTISVIPNGTNDKGVMYAVRVNQKHIYRYDDKATAICIADNLKRSLMFLDNVRVGVEIK